MRLAAQHSQSPYSMYAHIAGLKVVVPSDAADAMALMTAAIRDDNPVVVLEPARLAPMEGEVDLSYVAELGTAAVKRPGTDVTVVAIGYMVPLTLKVAESLESEGISVEVIDPRTMSPLDMPAILESVRRTGRLVIADEAQAMCSMSSEIAAAASEDPETFSALKAPPVRVCGMHVPIPFSGVLEDHVLPDEADVLAGIRRALG
jgi:pyruvate dehydrogenase E1 component beta subunit